ncbi:MAG: nucleotidyl transferase AbiEii/AbiGii toxin family protein [Verrucomicrobiota bacterium]
MTTLPEAQRAVWPELKSLASRFVLYGGTALALRLGHRQSEDFDFFSDAPVNPDELLNSLPLLKGVTVRQKAANTLTVTVHRPQPVKISFFGLSLRRVKNPEATSDGVARVASLLDIAACKMAVVQSRSESKDYLDAAALLKNGVTLADALGAAQAVYGEQFNPLITLKALNYFGDGDLAALPEAVKQLLRAAATIKEVTHFEPLPGGIVPAEKS